MKTIHLLPPSTAPAPVSGLKSPFTEFSFSLSLMATNKTSQLGSKTPNLDVLGASLRPRRGRSLHQLQHESAPVCLLLNQLLSKQRWKPPPRSPKDVPRMTHQSLQASSLLDSQGNRTWTPRLHFQLLAHARRAVSGAVH